MNRLWLCKIGLHKWRYFIKEEILAVTEMVQFQANIKRRHCLRCERIDQYNPAEKLGSQPAYLRCHIGCPSGAME